MDLARHKIVSASVDDLNDIEAEKNPFDNELLTRAGMLMEDASTLALLSDSCEGNLAERILFLELQVTRIKVDL